MRVGVVILATSAEMGAALKARLERWREARIVVASSRREAVDAARAQQWAAMIVADFSGEPADPRYYDDVGHPLAKELVSLDPADVDRAVFVLDVKIAKLSRSEIVLKAGEDKARQQPPSRRQLMGALLRPAKTSPSPRPVLDAEACRHGKGCRACLDACSFQALAVDGGLPSASQKCVSCGACSAVCPTGAMQSPLFSDAQWAGMLQGFAASDLPYRVLVLTCGHASQEQAAGRTTVVERLPCVGVLGVTHWAVAAASAAGRVVAWCPDPQGCDLACSMNRMQSDLQTVAASLAHGGDRIAFVSGPDGLDRVKAMNPVPPAAGPIPTGRRRQDFVAAIRYGYGKDVPPDRAGQVFRVAAGSGCTLCGACNVGCPEDALRLGETDDAVLLGFSMHLCIGCGDCVVKCPEKVMALEPASQIADLLADQPTVIHSAPIARCQGCGAVLGSEAALNHLRSVLHDDPAACQALNYCGSCKMGRLWA